MKIQRILPVRRSLVQAFTLIELLVVIAIIALLAALSMGTFTMAQQASNNNRTRTTLQGIISALERYKEANGEFPTSINAKPPNGISTHSTTAFDGAQMLYQAITGDGYDQIYMASPPSPAPSHSSSNGSVDPNFASLTINGDFIPTQVTSGSSSTWKSKLNATFVDTSNNFYLIDGFGHPFQYDRAAVTSVSAASPVTPTTVNPTYDLWSYGTGTGTNDPKGTSLTDKQNNATATAMWIKNW
jgi:prepilin-type N-terminal cleavage/methylation domain-containing protein